MFFFFFKFHRGNIDNILSICKIIQTITNFLARYKSAHLLTVCGSERGWGGIRTSSLHLTEINNRNIHRSIMLMPHTVVLFSKVQSYFKEFLKQFDSSFNSEKTNCFLEHLQVLILCTGLLWKRFGKIIHNRRTALPKLNTDKMTHKKIEPLSLLRCKNVQNFT